MWRTGKRWLVPATGTDGASHAGIAYWVIQAPSFGVGLARRCGSGECRQFVESRLDARQRRVGGHVDVEPSRIRDLRHEAYVCERGRVAVAVAPCPAVLRQRLLQRLEANVDPVAIPAVLLLLREAQRADQVVEHAQVVERVYLARDLQRDRANARTLDRVSRQEWRRRMRLVERFDDRERLSQHLTVIERQRRNESLRIEREIVLGALAAHSQVD